MSDMDMGKHGTVIVFLDDYAVPNNCSEIHFFEDVSEAIRFSMDNADRKHLVKRINPDRWHRSDAE